MKFESGFMETKSGSHKRPNWISRGKDSTVLINHTNLQSITIYHGRIQKVLSKGIQLNYDVFLAVDWQREYPNTTKSGRHQPACETYHRRAHDGPTLNAGYEAL